MRRAAADERVRLGRLAGHREGEPADPPGGTGQHRSLGGFGDLAPVGRRFAASADEEIDKAAGTGDRRRGGRLGDGVGLEEDAEPQVHREDDEGGLDAGETVPRREQSGAATRGAAVKRGAAENRDGAR
ncbi:hypothetical protein QFZ22_005467 [Streptomyces canus]|uniref:Uncharacterized protein n=1 Tax=Streptomyces canus TaxID=58343 RepID=A0AAW8FH58_9ACTN|nr:hypothetical protein [Streptomyces canus]MDQ0909482.1 hypothetical protein [Streptomyces canus]